MLTCIIAPETGPSKDEILARLREGQRALVERELRQGASPIVVAENRDGQQTAQDFYQESSRFGIPTPDFPVQVSEVHVECTSRSTVDAPRYGQGPRLIVDENGRASISIWAPEPGKYERNISIGRFLAIQSRCCQKLININVDISFAKWSKIQIDLLIRCLPV
jgi:hypothetical protein